MIDLGVCLSGFCTGLFAAVVASLLNMIISFLFRLMQG